MGLIETTTINDNNKEWQIRLCLFTRYIEILSCVLSVFIVGVFIFNINQALVSQNISISISQLLQGILGITLFILALKGKISSCLVIFIKWKNSSLVTFFAPIIATIFLGIYKYQINDFESYLRRISEGSLIEWLGFLFLLLSSILLWINSSIWRGKIKKLFIRFTSIVLFLLAMEEMSWGQMIFNWGTPDLINNYNIQHETNIHNLSIFHAHSWTVGAVVMTCFFLLSLIGFNLRSRARLLRSSFWEILLPIGMTTSYFAIASSIYWAVVIEKNGVDIPYLHTREQEIAELLFSVAILIHVIYLYLYPIDKNNSVQKGN